MKHFRSVIILTAVFFSFAAAAAAQSRITLEVDATEAGRGLIHVSEKLTVTPGRVAVFYPKWIPGEHSPTGTINNMINFHVSANGKPVTWNRDNVEIDRKSTRLNSSHIPLSRMPSSA